MMKLKRILIIIMSLLIMLMIFPKNMISFANNENGNEHNKKILEKVQILQELAEEYIEENNITDNTATELCMQYMRKDRYNSELWNTLLGSIDTEFINYLDGKTNVPTFSDEVLIDPNTGKEIDFVHMIAPLNAYLKYGDKVMYVVSTDYAGWAGDLITLLEEITVYRTENNIDDKNELQEYTNSLLGTNNASTCPDSDILADLDAIALYKDSTNKIQEDLYNALYKYYVSVDSTYNAKNRLEVSQVVLGGTKELVKQKASNLLTNTNLGRIDVKSSLFENSSVVEQVTSDDIDVVSESFANYVYGIPYLELQKSTGNGIVGQAVIDIKIIESNAYLKNENIEIENNKVAKAEIYGEYLRITPLDEGTTKITVYSADKTASSTYELTSKNVIPSITKNLDETYELTLNEEKEISIEAEGTNNVYTWYIQNSTDETFEKIAETEEGTYKIVPTLEMNNAYIKCGVKNNGNEEVFSNTAKLIVNNNGNGENDDDMEQGNLLNEVDGNSTDEDSSDTSPTIIPDAGEGRNILLIISVILVITAILYKKIKGYKEV